MALRVWLKAGLACRHTRMKLPYRILVLDDDENALEGILELLRDAGYAATGAAMFEAAREMLASEPFDLLIADVRLRGFNGLHLVRQIRRDRPEMATMIMTGYDDTMMELESGRYGAAFVRKPINPAAFLEYRRKVTRRDQAPAALAAQADRRRLSRDGQWPSCGRSGCVLRRPAPRDASCLANCRRASAWTSPHSICTSTWTRCGANLPPTAPHFFVAPRSASDSSPAAETWRNIVDRLSA